MNTGVCTTPWGVCSVPRRARPSVWSNWKANDMIGAGARGTRQLSRYISGATQQRPHLNAPGARCASAFCGPEATSGVKKLRIGIIYGGRSGEHEVSIASAASIFRYLDRDRFEPIPIRIEKDGRWLIADWPPTALAASEVIEQARIQSSHPARGGRQTHMVAYPADEPLLTIERSRSDEGKNAYVTGLSLDVVFPVLHGPLGEDGTVQGLLELANLPYVGAGVLASAVGMDKAVMKVVFAAAGLPVSPGRVVLRHEWDRERDAIAAAAPRRFGYPLFVKPANLGSSVGISKAADLDALVQGIDLAFEFDRKVLVEQAVPEAREIECAVLGNEDPEASVPGEIVPHREFYDYEAKYLDDQSAIVIPAPLPGEQQDTIRQHGGRGVPRHRRRRAWRGSTSCCRGAPVSCSSTR